MFDPISLIVGALIGVVSFLLGVAAMVVGLKLVAEDDCEDNASRIRIVRISGD